MLKPVLRYLSLVALVLALPELAQASGGISEFSSPLEKVVQTVTGPAGSGSRLSRAAHNGPAIITMPQPPP